MPYPEQPASPISRHELGDAEFVQLPLDAEPIRAVHGHDGPADVLAEIREISGTNSYEDYQRPLSNLLVVRQKDGQLELRAADDYDATLSRQPLRQSYDVRPRIVATGKGTPKVGVLFRPPATKDGPASLYIAPQSLRGSEKLVVATANGAGRPSQSGEHLSTIGDRNAAMRGRKRAQRFAGVALAAAVAYGSNTTGGLVDTARDYATEAGSSVEQAFPSSDPVEAAAVERVAAVMRNLDAHNYEAVEAGAAQFEQQNADLLMSEAESSHYYRAIEAAESHDEILGAANEFVQYYGKSARYQAHTGEGTAAFDQTAIPLETFRQQVLGLVDAYAPLPRTYAQDGRFSVIEFAAPVLDAAGRPDRAGEYDGHDQGTIRLVAYGDDVENVRSHSRKTVIHETGHARDVEIDLHEASQKDAPLLVRADFILRGLVDNPADVSLYAAANTHNEKYAEAAAHVYSPADEGGLAHPDNARLFESPANRQLMAELVALEKVYPGISNYIVDRARTADSGSALPIPQK